MSDISLFSHFIFAALATAGFAVFFNVPLKLLFPSGVVGGIGWIIYIVVMNITSNTSLSGFIAAAAVSIMSEILARKLYQPAILFVISGILPLIPGIGLYNTMLAIIQSDYTTAMEKGANAFLLSCAIALGVLVISALVRTVNIYRFKGDLLANLRPLKKKREFHLESDTKIDNSDINRKKK
ncbi:threonine/serine exporter [Peptacetobacter hominis]|uniref:Threonine/serine exporter n=1 Tax=Peptacetobacter hominis TaxID=2743610 RepID=A0A544QTE9_9FIRM|nr:threonine/serine exporter family protein [Peptacetobacter hominis]TQQ83972.1 threonine/serine exporter [Peptacetobacter hominis]